jgi:signal transduction histidine kinase/ligand-binding sensor domain-containing protein
LNPALDISQYAHKPWTINDGFFKGYVQGMAQTPDGYLWLGTESGLLRFDGVRTVDWEPPPGEQLPSNDIRSLRVSRDGALWIATFKGLARWKAGRLTHYGELAGHSVGRIFEDHEGTIWASGANPLKLCAIQKTSIQCYEGDGPFGSGVTVLYEYQGFLWLGAVNGLWRWKPAALKHYGMSIPLANISDMIEGDNGALWMLGTGGIRQLVGEKLLPYPLAAGGQWNGSRWLRDREGGLWIGTQGQGLLHLHQGRTDKFTAADGLSSDFVLSLCEDREGSVWVATTGGLDRFQDLAVPTISFKQGLSGANVNSALAAADGSIWLGTNDGLDRWNNGRITVFRTPAAQPAPTRGLVVGQHPMVHEIYDDGLPDNLIEALAQDSRGRIWVATPRGIAWFEDERFVRVNSTPRRVVYSITEDTAGSLWWTDMTEGLFHFGGGQLHGGLLWDKLGLHESPIAMALDRTQGGLWFGFSQGGVAHYKDGQIRSSYSAANGLGTGRVSNVRLDRDAVLWAATAGGLSRLQSRGDAVRITTLNSKSGLPCDSVHWTMEDDVNSVWVFTECGLVRIAQGELDAWSRDPKRVIHSTLFDASSGIRGRSVVYGFNPHVSKAPDGKLWFATFDGVAVIDPRHLPTNQLLPPVQIEQITADRKTWWNNRYGQAPSSLRLPPLTRDLVIDYTALSFVATEKVRFRFKLEGHDRDWTDAANRRQAFYNDLPPRNYRFRVQACNNSGVWNEAGAFVDFSIAPTLLQTLWFQALCLAAFLALLALLYQWRMRYLAYQYEIRTEARVDERIRIARDLHDTLLQSFQGLLLKFHSVTYDLPGRPDAAQKTLESAIEQARQAITEGRDAIQGLRSCAITSDLAQAVTVLGEELNIHHNGDHPPEFRVQVEGLPRDLAPLLQDDVYRIAGEALRNAFRHAHARRIEVEIRYDQRQFRLRIRDDGKGIDPKFLTVGGRTGHFGLPGMQERAKLLGGKLTVWSELDSGTEIELIVPASIAYATAPARRWFLFRKKEPVVHD